MSVWNEASKKFEENSYGGLFFESQSVLKALSQIQNTLKSDSAQMIFLLGEPGSGKSFTLNHLRNYYRNERECLVIENPYITPIELLKRMLNFAGLQSDSKDVEEMRLEAIEVYKQTPHIIMIDEAQLTSAPLREFIRILSDSKAFWFLIAMHTKEGEELLRSAHFHSRPHQVVYMGHLQLHECKPYLQKNLKEIDLWSFVMDLGDELVKKSWGYSKGNFRNFKKLYHNLFLLLDYANKHNKKDFLKPSNKLMYMSAVRSGLIEEEKKIDDFDELASLQEKSSVSKKTYLAFGLIVLLLSALAYLFLPQIEQNIPKIAKENNTSKESLKKPEKNTTKSIVKEPVKQVVTVLARKLKPTVVSVPKNPPSTHASNEENESLVFYPPQKKEVFIDKAMPLPEEEILVIDAKDARTKRPVFLDDKVRRKEPLFQIKRSKPKNERKLIKSFLSSPSYDLALKIASIYYRKKDYKNSASWAKKANNLNKKREDAWILFAKSKYNLGQKKQAISVLELYLHNRQSKKITKLLNQWGK